MGATAGMVEGRGIICGGAVEEYVECSREPIGENMWCLAERNRAMQCLVLLDRRPEVHPQRAKGDDRGRQPVDHRPGQQEVLRVRSKGQAVGARAGSEG